MVNIDIRKLTKQTDLFAYVEKNILLKGSRSIVDKTIYQGL